MRQKSTHTRWVEEIAPLAVGDSENGASFLGSAVARHRIIVAAMVACIGILFLSARVVQLQIISGSVWRALAEHNRLRVQPIIPERGIVFDQNMIPLVTNVPSFRLTLRAQDLPSDATERERAIRTIGATIGVSSDKIDQILGAFSKYRYASVVVKDPITYDEAVQIYLKSAAFPSLTIERSAKRAYMGGIPGAQKALPLSMSHVLGYVGRISPDQLETRATNNYFPTDTIGQVGVEAAFEDILRGTPGQRDIEVDAKGSERRTVSVQEPVAGDGVVLTIDLNIQNELEKTLAHGLAMAGKRRGAAIAVDPRDGSILGLVSSPSYDNNIFSGGISNTAYGGLISDVDQPLLNRAIAGQLPSGSIIKPFIASAALQEGVITPETTVLSTGGLQVGNHFFPDWKAGGHGVTDVRKAIAESVNTFFYTVGGGYGNQQGLGPDRIKRYLEYFGFGRSTGIALPGEQKGFLPSPNWKLEVKGEPWYIGDTYNISIGQGDVLVTPLQMAMGVAAIVNGGTLWQPRIASYALLPDNTEQVFPPHISAKVPVDDKWLEVVREGMRLTVTAGSAQSLKTLPLAVAGKTGTAQWSSTKAPHAWFTSFAPYENPQIVVVYMIEEGKEGSSVCVPAAKEFYTWWANYKTT